MSGNKRQLSKDTQDATRPRSKPNPFSKDMIFDPMGQWAHPGEITVIPSGNITMKGVGYPVLGVDNFGNRQMMMPGMDYRFPGSSVTEYPMLSDGGVVEQTKSYNCGPYAAAQFLKRNGIKTKPSQLEGLLGTNKQQGTRPQNIRNMFQQFGGVQEQYDSNIAELARNTPALVAYQFNGDGHYGVVNKVANNKVYIDNVAKGKQDAIPISQFNKRWHDKNSEQEYNKWFMSMNRMQDGGVMPYYTNTPLSKELEAKFKRWQSTLPPEAGGGEKGYDTRAAWMSLGTPEDWEQTVEQNPFMGIPQEDGRIHFFTIGNWGDRDWEQGKVLKYPYKFDVKTGEPSDSFNLGVQGEDYMGSRMMINPGNGYIYSRQYKDTQPDLEALQTTPTGFDKTPTGLEAERYQPGGEYQELELSDAEIAEYKKKGYTVEEISDFQDGGNLTFFGEEAGMRNGYRYHGGKAANPVEDYQDSLRLYNESNQHVNKDKILMKHSIANYNPANTTTSFFNSIGNAIQGNNLRPKFSEKVIPHTPGSMNSYYRGIRPVSDVLIGDPNFGGPYYDKYNSLYKKPTGNAMREYLKKLNKPVPKINSALPVREPFQIERMPVQSPLISSTNNVPLETRKPTVDVDQKPVDWAHYIPSADINFNPIFQGTGNQVGHYYDDAGNKIELTMEDLMALGDDAIPLLESIDEGQKGNRVQGAGNLAKQYQRSLQIYKAKNDLVKKQTGGDYQEMDLTDEEIAYYKKLGYRIEELE